MSNPFFIKTNGKRSRDDFESNVWTLDELERLKNDELDHKVKEWRYAGLSMDPFILNPDTVWPGAQLKFRDEMEKNLHGKLMGTWTFEEIRDHYKEGWDRYWNMFLLLGRAKIIPEVMIIKKPELEEEEQQPYCPKQAECLGRYFNFREKVIKEGPVVSGVASEPGSPILSDASDEY